MLFIPRLLPSRREGTGPNAIITIPHLLLTLIYQYRNLLYPHIYIIFLGYPKDISTILNTYSLVMIMPGGDRTGPRGEGPRTGRRAGFCSGYKIPGYANRFNRIARPVSRGFQEFQGRIGRIRGRGGRGRRAGGRGSRRG